MRSTTLPDASALAAIVAHREKFRSLLNGMPTVCPPPVHPKVRGLLKNSTASSAQNFRRSSIAPPGDVRAVFQDAVHRIGAEDECVAERFLET